MNDVPSMRRFDVELFIIHPSLTPTEISQALALEPTNFHCVGEQRRTPKRELPGKYRDTRWRYSRRFEVDNQWFHDAIDQFVAELLPHREFLERVRTSGGRTDLILQFLGDGYHGDSISSTTLSLISSLGLDFAIEVYAERQAQPGMKNIQVVNGAQNCVYDIFQATDEEFAAIFPEGQDIAFIDEVVARSGKSLTPVLEQLWSRRIPKRDVQGIHGLLFYKLDHKKAYYPTRRDEEAINPNGSKLRA